MGLSVRPSARRHSEMGSLWMQLLLQFLTNLFETLQVFFFMVWRCVSSFGVILTLLFINFFHFFFVGTTSPRVFLRSFWNYAYLFYMVSRCACGFRVTLPLFFINFFCFFNLGFSSPERKLRISCCDHPLSIVSTVSLLTLYRSQFWPSLDETCTEYLPLWNLGQVRCWVTWGQKIGHQAKSKENLVNTLAVIFLQQPSWILLETLILMISRSSSKQGHLGSKTRSPGQIKGKPCWHSSSHIFEATIMNLAQNVCLDDF